jgi:hypothetical protein
LPAEVAESVLSISALWKSQQCHALAAAWRMLYSALVGRFAGRRKVWEDAPQRPGIARWAEWQRSDVRTSKVVHCRSIAGRCQELRERKDTSESVPLLYGCVTAFVRQAVVGIIQSAGLDNVVSISCDSVWLTRAGWQQCQRALSSAGIAPDWLSTKSIYDRVWFTGKSAVVVERSGQRCLKAPGLGDGAILDEQHKCASVRAVPWSQASSFDPSKGSKRRKVVYGADRIIQQYGHAAEVLPLGETVDDILLREELLLPVKCGRSVVDE